MKKLLKFLLVIIFSFGGLNSINAKSFKTYTSENIKSEKINTNMNPIPSPPIIGHVTAGSALFVANISTLKAQWEAWLFTNTGHAVLLNFSSFQIYYDPTEGNYSLQAINTAGTIKYSVALFLNGNNDLLEVQNQGGTTLTCTGCAVGCSPRWNAETGDGYCTSCTEGSGCTKSETSSLPGVFY